jgi:putative acetyltransferase
MTIRQIQPADNEQIAAVVRSVLIDFNVPKEGTAYADPQLDYMFETYNLPNSAYFIIKSEGRIVGGAGIAPLENGEANTCELQKMYFLPEARGRGLGAKIMDICLKKAIKYDFEKCYLETMSYMEAAQKLYQNTGFQYLDAPMGDTGHTNCGVWMIKELNSNF